MEPPRFLFRVHDTQTDAHTPYSLVDGFTSGMLEASGFPTGLASAEIDDAQLKSTIGDFRTDRSNPVDSIRRRCQAWSAIQIPLKPRQVGMLINAPTLTFEAVASHVGTYTFRSKKPSPFISTSASFEYACWEARRRQRWSFSDLQISVIDYQKVQDRTFLASLPLECHPDPSEVKSLINFASAFKEHFVIGNIPADAVVATVSCRSHSEFVAALPSWFHGTYEHERFRTFRDECKQAAVNVPAREALDQSFASARYILTRRVGDNPSRSLETDLARVLYGLRDDAHRFDKLRCVME
jgi:hypothetical protein